MKTATTTVLKADFAGTPADGTKLFLEGTSASNKGFGDTDLWTKITSFAVDKAALANSPTVKDGSPVTYDSGTVNLTKNPVLARVGSYG